MHSLSSQCTLRHLRCLLVHWNDRVHTSRHLSALAGLRIIPHTTIILHSTNILTVLHKQHSTFFLSHTNVTTYSSSLSQTQPHTKHPLHYTTTLFIKLHLPRQPDTHTNLPYIHIYTHNSPFITPLQLLLTVIIPYNKYAYA